MYKGAVFFDMDGTIIDARHGIDKPTEKTVQTIRQLACNGYLVGLATGRSKCYVPEFARLFDCYITSNGAHAEVGETIVSDCFVESAELEKLTAYLNKIGINYIIEGQQCCFCKDRNDPYYRSMMTNYSFSDQYFYPLQDIHAIPANKLMVTYDRPEKIEQFMRDYGNLYDITLQPGNQACDVGMKGISKGYGVKKVIEFLQLDLKSTYAFGDADNDYDMLRTVGSGIAMGYHSEKLEQAACLITGSVEEEGIYEAAKKFSLI